MDAPNEEKIIEFFANLMRFYKGGITYSDLQVMPLTQVYNYAYEAERITQLEERATENAQKDAERKRQLGR